MKATRSKRIGDLLVIQPEIHRDARGENVETFNHLEYSLLGSQRLEFVVDSVSHSRQGVLRGFHGDEHTWKLIQCLYGEVFFVVLDMRTSSLTKHNYEIFALNDRNRTQVLVPAGCVNAHLCMSKECVFSYKLTHGYVKQENQIHVKWNDPRFNISWPIENPILSERDA